MATDPRAFGNAMFAPLPYHGMGAGYRTEYGTMVPTGGKVVAYVHNGGATNLVPQDIAQRLYTNVPDALNLCRANTGDTIVVLPGHVENVDSADDWANLKAGTQIIGMGAGNDRPTFTWSTATSTILLNVASVRISNCIMLMAGPAGATAITVAAPMTVSAAGCTIDGCRIQTEIDADQGSTVAITTTAAADDFTIANCRIHGDGDGTLVTTAILLIGADRFTMQNCSVFASTSSTTVGVVQNTTTVCLAIVLDTCTFVNKKAASVQAVTTITGTTGYGVNCGLGILDNTTTVGTDAVGDIQWFHTQVANDINGSGGIDKTLT